MTLVINEFVGATYVQKIASAWERLQGSVDNILDANADKKQKFTQKGVKQVS